jgi:hypothetical protein
MAVHGPASRQGQVAGSTPAATCRNIKSGRFEMGTMTQQEYDSSALRNMLTHVFVSNCWATHSDDRFLDEIGCLLDDLHMYLGQADEHIGLATLASRLHEIADLHRLRK